MKRKIKTYVVATVLTRRVDFHNLAIAQHLEVIEDYTIEDAVKKCEKLAQFEYLDYQIHDSSCIEIGIVS